jgi:hypothetical protein
MTARYTDIDALACAEIVDACLAAGRPGLIPSLIRDGVYPEEVRRLLAKSAGSTASFEWSRMLILSHSDAAAWRLNLRALDVAFAARFDR